MSEAPRLRGHEAARARIAARIAGRLTYQGQPCGHGHQGRRYVSGKHCVECHAARVEWGRAQYLNALLIVLYEAEFDALGQRWHKAVGEVP